MRVPLLPQTHLAAAFRDAGYLQLPEAYSAAVLRGTFWSASWPKDQPLAAGLADTLDYEHESPWLVIAIAVLTFSLAASYVAVRRFEYRPPRSGPENPAAGAARFLRPLRGFRGNLRRPSH